MERVDGEGWLGTLTTGKDSYVLSSCCAPRGFSTPQHSVLQPGEMGIIALSCERRLSQQNDVAEFPKKLMHAGMGRRGWPRSACSRARAELPNITELIRRRPGTKDRL